MLPESSKKALRRPDEFVGFFEKRLYQFETRKKHFFWILGVLIAITIVGFLVESRLSATNQKAANEFAKVMDKLPSNLSKETGDWKTFLDEIEKFQKQFPRASVIPVTHLYKAKAQFSLKQYSEALVSYQTAAKKMQAPYQYLAMEGEAITQMELQQWEKALEIWKNLEAKKDNPLRDFHLYNLALVQEQLGHTDLAAEAYRTLEKDFPSSSYSETAKLKLASSTPK